MTKAKSAAMIVGGFDEVNKPIKPKTKPNTSVDKNVDHLSEGKMIAHYLYAHAIVGSR